MAGWLTQGSCDPRSGLQSAGGWQVEAALGCAPLGFGTDTVAAPLPRLRPLKIATSLVFLLLTVFHRCQLCSKWMPKA